MSTPNSRAERRRHSKGSGAPPPRRDPMFPVYVGFGIVIVLIFAIFAIMRVYQQHQLVAAYATPSPGPNATAHPIQLADGESLGKPMLPMFDTPQGGHGAPVDGIQCETTEGVKLHIHAHLALFVRGVQMQIPKLIGFPSPAAQCLYWTHTHDASGIIHVESPHLAAPNGGPFRLGMFFDIWGEPLGHHRVATFTGNVTAFVNGAPYDGNPREIPLYSHQEITLEVGKPVVPPPNYIFPPDD